MYSYEAGAGGGSCTCCSLALRASKNRRGQSPTEKSGYILRARLLTTPPLCLPIYSTEYVSLFTIPVCAAASMTCSVRSNSQMRLFEDLGEPNGWEPPGLACPASRVSGQQGEGQAPPGDLRLAPLPDASLLLLHKIRGRNSNSSKL